MSHSVSIRKKREALRSEVRRDYLKQYFGEKRHEFSLQCEKPSQSYSKIFDLFTRIEATSSDSNQFRQLVSEVRQCAFENILEGSIYVLIGDCILKDPKTALYFKEIVLNEQLTAGDSPRPSANHTWCLGVFLIKMTEIESVSGFSEQMELGDSEDLSTQIDRCLSAHLVKQLDCFEPSRQCIKVVEELLLFGQLYLDQKKQQFVMSSRISTTIMENIGRMYYLVRCQQCELVGSLKENLISQTRYIVEDLKAAFEPGRQEVRKKHSEADRLLSQFCKAISVLLLDCLKISGINRETSIFCIKTLFDLQPYETLEYILTKETIQELIYLATNLNHSSRLSILKLFLEVLFKCTNDFLKMLLTCNIHVTFVVLLNNGLESSLYRQGKYHGNFSDIKKSEDSNDMILYSLRCIESMFQKIEDLGQKFLDRKILGQMEDARFYEILDSMKSTRFSEEIEQVYNNILDMFYSEEEEPLRYQTVQDPESQPLPHLDKMECELYK